MRPNARRNSQHRPHKCVSVFQDLFFSIYFFYFFIFIFFFLGGGILPSAKRNTLEELESEYIIKKIAMTCNFQQCGILTGVDSDEPLQPPFMLRNSKWCSASSLTIIEYSSDKQRL